MSRRVLPGIQRAFVANIIQHRATHPAHAHSLIRELEGHFHGMFLKLPDDPLLAGPFIVERLPSIRGKLNELERWARAVTDCDPADSPDHGARVCN